MYVFSKTTLMFYPVELIDVYKTAGTWPDDGIEVSEDVYNEFNGNPPANKMRVAGADGLPAWADIPAPDYSIDDLKKSATAAVNHWRAEQENSHTRVSLLEHEWDVDKLSLERINIAVSQNLPDGFFWTDANNTDVPLNADQLKTLAAAMETALFAHGFAIHKRQREMKRGIEAMDINEILAFVPGWGR